MRPGGELAQRALTRVRPAAADLADAALWDGARRGAARLQRRLLLRSFVASALGVHVDGVEVRRDAGGRPHVVAPLQLHASVARRGAWAALALHGRPVGVDLEVAAIAADWSLLAAGDREAATGGDHGPGDAFAAAWSAREAYLKATGAGLAGAAGLRLHRDHGALKVEGPDGPASPRYHMVEGLLACALTL